MILLCYLSLASYCPNCIFISPQLTQLHKITTKIGQIKSNEINYNEYTLTKSNCSARIICFLAHSKVFIN